MERKGSCFTACLDREKLRVSKRREKEGSNFHICIANDGDAWNGKDRNGGIIFLIHQEQIPSQTERFGEKTGAHGLIIWKG